MQVWQFSIRRIFVLVSALALYLGVFHAGPHPLHDPLWLATYGDLRGIGLTCLCLALVGSCALFPSKATVCLALAGGVLWMAVLFCLYIAQGI
jgi:hypothetical protein